LLLLYDNNPVRKITLFDKNFRTKGAKNSRKTKKVLREIALIKAKNNEVRIPVRAPLQNHPELYKKIKTQLFQIPT
jgi:hypothetical protein